MISEADFAEVAATEEPELAFVRLESRFRKTLEDNLESSQNNVTYEAYIIEYMNHTLAAARFFNLDILEFWTVPEPGTADEIYKRYQQFTTEIDYYKVQVQLTHLRRPKDFSVGLSTTDKEKIRFFIEQIKTVIDKAGLSTEKREALFNKLNAFLAEVDRSRASWDKFSDIVIGIATLGGNAAEKLEPARLWIDSIAKLLGNNKEVENSQPHLPKPSTKRIENHSQRSSQSENQPTSQRGRDPDDEIPF
jgi:hypothetical protein